MNTLNGPRRQAALITAGALAIGLIASACSSSGSANNAKSSSGPGTQSASSTQSGPANARAQAQAVVDANTAPITAFPSVKPISGLTVLKGKTIWYIPIGSAVPTLSLFGQGTADALKTLGMKTHICDGKFVPTSIASCMEQAITQGAAGVITGYVDYSMVPNAYSDLAAHHVPVLIGGEVPSAGKKSSPALAFFDTSSMLKAMIHLGVNALIADAKGKANVLFVRINDSPAVVAMGEAGAAELKSGCPSCSVASVTTNSANLAKLPSLVSAALIAHPGVNYVLVQADADVAPTVAGIQAAGATSKVKIFSTGGDLDALQRVRSGAQVQDAGTSSIYLGWQFADGILRMLTGSLPDTTSVGIVRLFTKTNVAGLTLTPTGYATNDWYGSGDAFEKNFRAAWGVG